MQLIRALHEIFAEAQLRPLWLKPYEVRLIVVFLGVVFLGYAESGGLGLTSPGSS